MKEVTLQDLKKNLFGLVAEAEGGEQVVITRHKKPVAQLISAGQEHVRTGRRFGKAKFTPVLKGPTRGRYLEVLAEDRKEDPKRR